MRKSLCLIVVVLLGMTSCEDKRFQTYLANVPQYMSYKDLRSSFEIKTEQPLEKPGKIYFKDEFMYINEYQKGVHVVDLSDPSHPEKKAFINIPGNVDIAIKDNVLYADSFIDLVLIDISDPSSPGEIKRAENVFEYVIPPYDYEYPLDNIDQEKGVILGYEIEKITHEIHNPVYPWPIYYDYMSLAESSGVKMNGGTSGGGTYGIGGSMARFITYDQFLYTLESTYKLKTFAIENLEEPVSVNEQYLWGNIETIFISDSYMYIGSSSGMHIMSLEEPSNPVFMSTYQHITSCDPVVVTGNKAYVTLRAGNSCGGNQNLLEVVNIENKYGPKRIASFAMTEPYGLGIDGNILFVCEGPFGLKVYDASDPYNITGNKLAGFPSIYATDVIPLSSFLCMIGEDGFYIYDYSNINQIKLLGTLPVHSPE